MNSPTATCWAPRQYGPCGRRTTDTLTIDGQPVPICGQCRPHAEVLLKAAAIREAEALVAKAPAPPTLLDLMVQALADHRPVKMSALVGRVRALGRRASPETLRRHIADHPHLFAVAGGTSQRTYRLRHTGDPDAD